MKPLLQYLLLSVLAFNMAGCPEPRLNVTKSEASKNSQIQEDEDSPEQEEQQGDRTPPCGGGCSHITYSWYQGGYGACSKPCGGGIQTQIVECRSNKGVVVPDSYCLGEKPKEILSCNLQECASTYTWNVGEFGECSKTCGGGVRTRTVVCQNDRGVTVADSFCRSPKPATTEPCNATPCPPTYTYTWVVTEGECSKDCGGGTATDLVVCKRDDGTTVEDSFCASVPKPPIMRTCNPQECPIEYTYEWEPQKWSKCCKPCGTGTQTRAVACRRNDGAYSPLSFCDATTKPITSRDCNKKTCPVVTHKVTQELYVTPALNAVDVIVVVDDSGSMKADQLKLSKRMNHLMSDLDALNVDHQLCITTTDTQTFGGSPLKWVGHQGYVLHKSTVNRNKVFVDTIEAIGKGWGNDERGILAVNLMARDFRPSGCFRPDATLAVLLISDEDERSVGGIAALSKRQYRPLEPMDHPDNLISNVHAIFDRPDFVKPFIWNSIIVKPGDKKCEKEQDRQESVSFAGVQYAKLSNLTNGHIGSICAPDYTENLKFIKDRIFNTMPGMKLKCVPVGTPVVTFNKSVTTKVTLSGDELKFSPVIPEGITIKAVYNCPQPQSP